MVKLDGVLLKALVATRYHDGVTGLLRDWVALDRPPDRATVYRWLDGGFPRGQAHYLQLCKLLDVDPFCLLQPGRDDPIGTANRLIYAFQNDHWKPRAAITFIKSFMGRQPAWPPADIAQTHFCRPWHTVDFEHKGNKSEYAVIRLESPRQTQAARPQVFHFAFRHHSYFGGRWLQYGLVIRGDADVRLVHINGHIQRYAVHEPVEPTHVETYFGDGPAIFRVASLHSFTLDVAGAGSAEAGRCVRFPA